MSRDEVRVKVLAVIEEEGHKLKDGGVIEDSTRFTEDLDADSLDNAELVMEFEDQFHLTIPEAEAEKLLTVGAAVDWIYEHQSMADEPAKT